MASPPLDPSVLFAAPVSPIGPVVTSTADPAIVEFRLRYVRHERAVRSLGLLMYALAAWAAVSEVPGRPGLLRSIGAGRATTLVAGHLGETVVVVGLIAQVGVGLRRLRGWARGLVLVPTVLGLLALFAAWVVRACGVAAEFVLPTGRGSDIGQIVQALGASLPPGLVLSLCCFLLGSERGAAVFSDPYRAAVAATPELNPRVGPIVRLGFGLLLACAGIALAARLANLFR